MANPKFEFLNKLTAGIRALTYPDTCADIEKYPIYGDFSSAIFNRSIIPIIEFLAPKSFFSDAKKLVRIFGAFEKGIIRKLNFDQEILLGGGRDPVAFYRALQNKQTKVIEINLPDFTILKQRFIAEKCEKFNLEIPNLHIMGMDLLKDELSAASIYGELDANKNLLVYENGLTMYLSQPEKERLYENIDKLFHKMNNKCIFLTSSFDIRMKSIVENDKTLNGMIYVIEKLFQHKINTNNHSLDSFFRQRGYRVVQGGEILHYNIPLDTLHGGLSITGYVLHEL